MKLVVESLEQLFEKQMTAYHGSPHRFDRFSTDYMGTGEGNQSYGWGLYFTDKENLAKHYAKSLGNGNLKQQYKGKDVVPQSTLDSAAGIINDYQNRYNTISKAIKRAKELQGYVEDDNLQMIKYWDEVINWLEQSKISDFKKVPNNNLYQVSLHPNRHPDHYDYMRWDQPLTANQIEVVKRVYDVITNQEPDHRKASVLSREFEQLDFTNLTGEDVYKRFSEILGNDKEASLILLKNGIDGIKYPTEYQSKGIHEDSYNYVVFDEKNIKIESVENV